MIDLPSAISALMTSGSTRWDFPTAACSPTALACELSSVFSAVGPVAGTLMFPACKPDRPVSILHLHGNADPVVGYGGGGSGSFPKVTDVIAEWARRDLHRHAAADLQDGLGDL
jgi:poly(3-hydroxybutyrate) depolymerase